jgi:type IV secretion system protein VirB10
MADPITDALASPDYLSTTVKRGIGVRRLNRVPVFIVTGIVSLVMAVVGYTMYEKRGTHASTSAAATKDQGDSTPSAADPQLLKNSQDRGVIAAAVPPSFTEGDVPVEEDPSHPQPESTHVPGVPSQSTSASGASPRDQLAEQWRQRLEQIQFQRLDDRIKAMQSETAIEANMPHPGQVIQSSESNATAPLDSAITRATQRINDANALAGGTVTGSNPGPPGGPGRNSFSAANGQGSKRDFINTEPVGSDYLQHGRAAPVSPYEVKAGTVIPANMIGGVNSDLPGLLLAQVSEHIYDSATGRYLLIPHGAKLIGTYDNGVTFGQSRVLVGWQRIIYPDGSSIDLGRMPGADESGYAGFKDKVDNHLLRLFGEAFALSIFSAGIQLGQPQASSGSNYNSSQIVAAAIAGQMGELGMEIVRRNMDVAPSLEIRPGYSFNVMVTKDMVVRPWSEDTRSSAQVDPTTQKQLP